LNWSIVVFLFSLLSSVPYFPNVELKPENQGIVKQAKEKYEDIGYDWRRYEVDYNAFGDYFNFSTKGIQQGKTLDDNGIPMFASNDKLYYHPVMIQQYALQLHSQYMKTGTGKEQFLNVADFIINLMDEDGSYRYPFGFNYYVTKKDLEPGWVSALAQGQALNVFARAYDLTKDDEYIKAGRKSFDFMVRPVSEGGTMTTLKDLHKSLDGYVFFDEYPIIPSAYTLNGFMFTMIGLYDWSQVDPESEAKHYFNKSLITLKHILKYYDIGGMTTYDMSFITHKITPVVNPRYHQVHVHLLDALYDITNDEKIKNYRDLWAGYVNQ